MTDQPKYDIAALYDLQGVFFKEMRVPRGVDSVTIADRPTAYSAEWLEEWFRDPSDTMPAFPARRFKRLYYTERFDPYADELSCRWSVDFVEVKT